MIPISFPFENPPTEGSAIEVAEDILWMRLPLPMALDHVNIYAIRDGDGWCVIDTGYFSKRSQSIWELLLSGPLKGAAITRVLLTHHHPDHIGMAGWFQTKLNSELVSSRTAWMYGRMMILDKQKEWPKEVLDFYISTGIDEDIYSYWLSRGPRNFSDVCYTMPSGYTRIKDGDIIKIGTRKWHVRTGDGHAPEHVTLWSMNDNIVIAGDQVLPGISSNIGVYPTEPLADPLSDWIETCEKFKLIAKDEHFVLPGHKLPFVGLPTRLQQLIDNHNNALPRLIEHLKTPRTAVGCFEILYKRKIGKEEYGLALVEAVAHLNHLFIAGKINRRMNEHNVWIWFV
ncbi:MBL fold metallo-hydrolase [Amylibacter sp.]|nr:MBL fold metallo-hydrolase [Amylibacter sp.]